MSKFEKSMEKVFDIPTKVVSNDVATPVAVAPIQQKAKIDRLEYDLDEDYEESRETLKQLVRKGNDAIDHLLAIATDTEHPRAFEVVATLIKNTAEANEKLMTVQKTIRELKNIKSRDNNLNVEKAIFVGSTSELSKLVKDLKNKEV